MEVVFSILTLIGMGYAVFFGLKWMMRSGIGNAHKEQPLTPNDLKVLEESAARLMADLRAVADECVERIDRACSEAEVRLSIFEKGHSPAQAPAPQLYEVIDLDEKPSVIAAYAGMTKGEIELLQGLSNIGN